MDRRSWPWKKKSSEKHTLVLESAADASLPNIEKETVKKPKYVQISVEQYTHLTGLEEQIKTYDVQIKSYESQVEAYEDKVKTFEEQIETYDEQVQSYAEQVQRLDELNEDLNEKLSAANVEITTKEALVKQHSKVAEDAVAGWEKADAEALTLKNTLESVTLSKLTAEDRAAHLDGALKECMRQIRNLKKDHEEQLHDIAFNKTKEIEKLTLECEKKISSFEQELLRSAADNDALSRTLQERSNMLVNISEEKSRADAEIATLKSNLEMCDKEVKSLKYEVHVVSKELEIRNEEKNMCIRSAEVANKQHLEGVKKIAKLEAECQRLRSLVRKKLPGPAALAQMKLEVENLGGGDPRLKRSPVKAAAASSSPCKSSPRGSDTSLDDNAQKFQKENEFLTERLLAMEEETKMLKEALAKRNIELVESRNLCAQGTSKLQSLESQLQQFKACRNLNTTSDPSSSISVSEDGNDDSGSSLSTTTPSKKEKEVSPAASASAASAALERVESVSSHVELMDDFLEMEKLACLPTQSSSVNGDQKSDEVMELRSRLLKVFESVSADAGVREIARDINRILQDVNPEEPSDESCSEQKLLLQSVQKDLTDAVSGVREFVLLLRKEVESVEFVKLIEGFSITSDRVLSGEKRLDDFVSDLADVFKEAMGMKVEFKSFASSEVEILSQDCCIDKVALPESKDSSKEIYQNGCVRNELSGYESDSVLRELEEVKSEKEKMSVDIEELKFRLRESEELLADIRSQFDSAQRSNSLADTQLRCMTESYRSVESRAAGLEIEVKQLKEKICNLENALENEEHKHQETMSRCRELEQHIQRNGHASLVDEDDEVDDIKTKQEKELAAAAEKLAECQETIFMLGKQLKTFRPQPEQTRSPRRQSESYPQEELGADTTLNNPVDEGDSVDTWGDEVPRFMESPKCASDSETGGELMTSPPSGVGSRLSRSGSSGNQTPEKSSRGISRFFSSK